MFWNGKQRILFKRWFRSNCVILLLWENSTESCRHTPTWLWQMVFLNYSVLRSLAFRVSFAAASNTLRADNYCYFNFTRHLMPLFSLSILSDFPWMSPHFFPIYDHHSTSNGRISFFLPTFMKSVQVHDTILNIIPTLCSQWSVTLRFFNMNPRIIIWPFEEQNDIYWSLMC